MVEQCGSGYSLAKEMMHDYVSYGKEFLEKRRQYLWKYWYGTMIRKMAIVERPGLMRYSWDETRQIIGNDNFIIFGELVDVVYGWRIKSPLDKGYYTVKMGDTIIVFKKEDIHTIILEKDDLKRSLSNIISY